MIAQQMLAEVKLFVKNKGEKLPEDFTEVVRNIDGSDEGVIVECYSRGLELKQQVFQGMARELLEGKDREIQQTLQGIGMILPKEGNIYQLTLHPEFYGDLLEAIEQNLQIAGYYLVKEGSYEGYDGFKYGEVVDLLILTEGSKIVETHEIDEDFDVSVYEELYEEMRTQSPHDTQQIDVYFQPSELATEIKYRDVEGEILPVAKAEMTEEYFKRFHNTDVLRNHQMLYGEFNNDPSGDQRLTLFRSNLAHAFNEQYQPTQTWIESDMMFAALRYTP